MLKFLMTTNWKTTLAGLLAIFSALISLILTPALDNDPLTVPQWGEFIPILIGGIGALFARDWNVTSRQSGLE